MGKIKIYEIAKKLDLTSKEVLEMAQKLNIQVKSHMSSVEEEEAKKIENNLTNKTEQTSKQQQASKKEDKTAKQNVTPKKEEKAPVIIRREVIINEEENKKNENKKQETKRDNNVGFVERRQNKDFNIVYRNKPNKPKTVNELFGLNKPEKKKEEPKKEEIKNEVPSIKEEIKKQGDSNLTMQKQVAEKKNITQENKFNNNRNFNNSNNNRTNNFNNRNNNNRNNNANNNFNNRNNNNRFNNNNNRNSKNGEFNNSNNGNNFRRNNGNFNNKNNYNGNNYNRRPLDEKGIVNSICSKNDYESAMKKLETFGLKDVFVFPKINWDPKSVNIQQIIQQMNISADTIVFVDDTAFEREEVKSAIKDITVVDQNEILEYVSLSRFEVPVTEDSKNRRNTYHMMEKQQEEQKAWKGNIDEFLRNCKMQLTIGKPFEDEIQRCYELLQRTNQLNASGRRLELEQVKKYWLSDTFDTSVLVCEDKFGSYGLVGFSIIEKKEIPIIIDFVISCRVANKKVEHSFIKNLAKKSNSGRIRIRYKKTDRNGPIFKVVTDLDMKLVNTEEGFEVYEYLLNSNDISDVVSVVERKWENEN